MDSSASSPLPPGPPPVPGNNRQLVSTMVAAGFLTFLADFLFWKYAPGVSLAIYVCIVAGIILVRGRPQWNNLGIRVAAGLMVAASCATALEISFTNVTVLLVLLAVICGECWYGELKSEWARWSEVIVAWFASPARWPWLVRRLNRTRWGAIAISAESGSKATRLFQILAPALWLLIIFGMILGFGNAVFSQLVLRTWNQMLAGTSGFDFSAGHILFYLVFATLALAWTCPCSAPSKQRAWVRTLPQIPRADTLVAIWQCRLVLIALNALFFTVNTIDVFYLWNRMQLPQGVSFSEFVHEGVYSLITAVLLSALVIALIFQQETRIKHARFLKGLSMFWIAQNLALIAGVFLRLKLYVEAYQLSELRIYVGCFLLLVMVGFGLLAWHVIRDGSLNALIFRCAIATFALFFIVQFANMAGAVAHYNVSRWRHDPKHTLDLAYLASLGPDAWQALVEVASVTNSPGTTSAGARDILQRFADEELARAENFNWRSWQVRRDRQSLWLIKQWKKYPVPGASLANQSASGLQPL